MIFKDYINFLTLLSYNFKKKYLLLCNNKEKLNQIDLLKKQLIQIKYAQIQIKVKKIIL